MDNANGTRLPLPIVAFEAGALLPVGAAQRVRMAQATPDDLIAWADFASHELGRALATGRTRPGRIKAAGEYVGVARYVASRLRAWMDHPECATLANLEAAAFAAPPKP